MLGFQFFADFGCERGEDNIMRECKNNPDVSGVWEGKRLSKSRTNRKALQALADEGWLMNCFAIYVPNNPRGENIYRWHNGSDVMQSAVTATFGHMDSDVATSSVSWRYMRTKGKRISERLARKLHPRLFAYLDTDS